jgi:hypothetical protein
MSSNTVLMILRGRKVRNRIQGLSERQQVELVALMWIGRDGPCLTNAKKTSSLRGPSTSGRDLATCYGTRWRHNIGRRGPPGWGLYFRSADP